MPCLLNVSAGAATMLSACRTAGVHTVVSSRSFVEKGRLGRVVERMSQEVRFVWLEDVRDTIGLRAKLRAKRDAWRARGLPGARRIRMRRRWCCSPAARRARRKGVVLSHRNLLTNCAQIVVGDRLPRRRHRVQRHADVPRVRSDRRHDPAVGVRRAHVPLSQPAALPHRAGVDLRHRRDDLLRHRHVPQWLGALRASVRLLCHALHLRRRGEGARGNQTSVRRPLRRAHAGRLRRHRDLAGARA